MHKTKPNFNTTAGKRQLALRHWMYQNNITWGDFGRQLGISAVGALHSLGGERFPVRHYNALVKAYPDIPRELLPEPRDVPPGPRPRINEEIVG